MATSQEHRLLVSHMKQWIKANEPYKDFFNRFDLPNDISPCPLHTVNEKGVDSIPDYEGYSDDGYYCALGEAKTDYFGQTIFDERAEKQLKAYMKFLKYYEKSLLLIAVPNEHIKPAKHEINKICKQEGFQGDVMYFNYDGFVG